MSADEVRITKRGRRGVPVTRCLQIVRATIDHRIGLTILEVEAGPGQASMDRERERYTPKGWRR